MKLQTTAIVALFTFTLSGCQKTDLTSIPEAPIPNVTNTPKQLNKKIDRYIFVDGSESMAGYATPGGKGKGKFSKYGVPNSNYYKTLKVLSGTMITASPLDNAYYHVFTDDVTNMSLDNFMSSLDSNFYTGTTTAIDEVIENPNVCKGDNLSVIITDLYQNQSYISPVLKELSKKCISDGYSIGVLAIKSQFNGYIYDLDTAGSKMWYSTDGKVESEYKPFYMLILGHGQAINSFHENLVKSLGFINANNSNFSVISQNIVDSPATLQEKVPEKKDLNCINNSKYEIRCNTTIFTKNSTDAWVKTSINYNPAKYGVPFVGENLPIEVSKVEKLSDDKRTFVKATNITKESISVIVKSVNKNTLSLEIKNNLGKIQKGIYRYEIVIRPPENSYKFPDWWSSWGTDNPGQDALWKTLNQRLFLMSTWKASYDLNKPEIGKIYYVVSK